METLLPTPDPGAGSISAILHISYQRRIVWDFPCLPVTGRREMQHNGFPHTSIPNSRQVFSRALSTTCWGSIPFSSAMRWAVFSIMEESQRWPR